MLYSILPLALMAFCVVHIIRTGADRIWVYVVIFLPGIGSLIYLAADVAPKMFRTPGAQRFAQRAGKRLDPERDLRNRHRALEVLDSADNKRLLAEEYMKLGRFEEAANLYRSSLSGIHADDPALLMGLARAAERAGDPIETLDALERLTAAHPKLDSTESQLLLGRAFEALGREDEALETYGALIGSWPGEEARCRYALLLRSAGRTAEAEPLFREILDRAEHANPRYRHNEREWIDTARRVLGGKAA